MNGGRKQNKRASVYVLSTVLWCVLVQDGLEKTESIPISLMTWKSNASKTSFLPTFVAEVSACRDALDLADCTRAVLCEVLTGGEV